MKINSAKLAWILLIMTAFCLVIAPKHTQSLGSQLPLDLFPGIKTAHNLFVPREEAVAVTADGALSDLLTPNGSPEKDPEPDISLPEKPRILIYHTHLTEAYRQTDGERYKESDEYRTKDNNYNVAAVGEVLKNELVSMGYEVIHDTENHEPPKLATAYSRSVKTMEKYEDIDLYIDLHRDASGSANIDDVVEVEGERCARMMFVVGQGYKSDGTEYDPKPNFEKTYALAEAVADRIREIDDNFMRETRVKRGRYNQHISDGCLLAEIGHNMNTLGEAKNAAKYLAKAIDQTIRAQAKG